MLIIIMSFYFYGIIIILNVFISLSGKFIKLAWQNLFLIAIQYEYVPIPNKCICVRSVCETENVSKYIRGTHASIYEAGLRVCRLNLGRYLIHSFSLVAVLGIW